MSHRSRLRLLPLLLAASCTSGNFAEDAQPSDATATDTPAEQGTTEPSSRAATRPFSQWANVFVATGGIGYGTGSAFPGPQAPFGLARPGPDTADESGQPSFAHCAGYNYADVWIEGFSHTRMHGVGIVDYGTIALMPTIGMSAEKTRQRGYRSRFTHRTEEGSPGYYAVTLDSTNVRVELTATEHTALHRYTFPRNSDAVVILDPGHTVSDVRISNARVQIDPSTRTAEGYAHMQGGYSDRGGGVRVYFSMRFDRPFTRHGVFVEGQLREGTEASSTATTGSASAGAWFAFASNEVDRVHAAVGLSFVDEAHARANREAEIPDPAAFDNVRRATSQRWEQELSRFEISARSEREFRIFYSALYHTLLMPTLGSDTDGSYRGTDGQVHRAEGFRYYTDLSLWDTFRTLHPFLTLAYPSYQRDFLRSMLAMARDGGGIDRWPLGTVPTGGMLGDSFAIVFADSWNKGLRDFDLREAYTVLRRHAMGPLPAGTRAASRDGIEDYLARGYVPLEHGDRSVALSLEYAYNDAALATLARALGENADAEMFTRRSRNWRNHFDPAQGFLVARERNGTFATLPAPTRGGTWFAEGNAIQYLWYVPHDPAGLAEAMGGRTMFLTRLDDFFQRSSRELRTALAPLYYWHGNEPDIHAGWLFSALDAPASTARWTRWIARTHYTDGPDGLPGNDDGGTLSAWYLFTALGLFPLAGGTDYLVGSPLVQRAVIHLPGGDLTIEAPTAGENNPYVRALAVDGVPVLRARVPHSALADGGSVVFEMGATENGWGRQ